MKNSRKLRWIEPMENYEGKRATQNGLILFRNEPHWAWIALICLQRALSRTTCSQGRTKPIIFRFYFDDTRYTNCCRYLWNMIGESVGMYRVRELIFDERFDWDVLAFVSSDTDTAYALCNTYNCMIPCFIAIFLSSSLILVTFLLQWKSSITAGAEY